MVAAMVLGRPKEILLVLNPLDKVMEQQIEMVVRKRIQWIEPYDSEKKNHEFLSYRKSCTGATKLTLRRRWRRLCKL